MSPHKDFMRRDTTITKKEFDKLKVNHKDRNRNNNVSANLELTTHRDNVRHGIQNNKKRKRSTLGTKIRVKKNGDASWTYFDSLREAARQLRISYSTLIYRLKHGNGDMIIEKVEEEAWEGEVWVKLEELDIEVSNMGRMKGEKHGICYGYKTPSGYVTTNIKKVNYVVHRLVVRAFQWDKVKKMHTEFCEKNGNMSLKEFWKNEVQVDHIDVNKSNNINDNLKPMLGKDHALKTLAQLGRSTDGYKKTGRKIRARKIVKRGSRGRYGGEISITVAPGAKWVSYDSQEHAARVLFEGRKDQGSAIGKVCKGKFNMRQYRGYQFEYLPQPDLPNERWRPVPQYLFTHSVKGMMASNLGRILTKIRIKTRGYQRPDGYYQVSRHLVHRLVLAAFLDEIEIKKY